jgi:hypothetical protein
MNPKIRSYEQGELPEWAQDKEGISHLLDGCRFQYNVNLEAEKEGQKVVKMDKLNMDDYKGLTQEQVYAEIVSGCVVAYLAAMSKVLDSRTFSRIITPLPDAIAEALSQVGILTEIPKERWDKLIEEMREKVKALEEKELREASCQSHGDEDWIEETDPDFREKLESMVERLKNASKNIIH